jgi:lipopolysaccharide export system protein LptC
MGLTLPHLEASTAKSDQDLQFLRLKENTVQHWWPDFWTQRSTLETENLSSPTIAHKVLR